MTHSIAMRALALALLLALCCAAPLARAEDAACVVVQSTCNVVPSGEYYLAYCYAQIHNNSSDVLCIERGTFDLQSGEQILSTQEVSQLWPYFIGPGEDGYLFDIVSFEPQADGTPFIPAVTGIVYAIDYMRVDAAHANLSLVSEATVVTEATGDMTVVCELTNPTSVDAYDATVAFGLYTAEGAMLYADGKTLQGVGVPAGGSVLVRFGIDKAFLDQWNAYGATPAQARVNAAFRDDQD